MKWHRNIKLLFFFNFFIDFRFWTPISILYFEQITGSFALAMAVFSVLFISGAVFEIPTGIFSDKIGRRNSVILGVIFVTVGLVLYAIGISPLILYLGAIFEGLGRSFYSGNNEALLHDSLAESHQEHEYHTYFGKTSAMFGLAQGLSALIGGYLAVISFSLVMWLTVIPQIIAFFLALRMVEPKIHLGESGNAYSHLKIAIQKFRENRKLRLLSIGSIITFGMGNAGYEFQQVFYNLIWPVWALGVARFISSISATISYYISGTIINRFTAIKVLLAGCIISPLVKIIVTLFMTPLSPIIMASMSMFHGTGTVSEGTLQQKEFTNEQRATMASLIRLGGSLFLAISSFILGIIADELGIISAVLFTQVVLLLTPFFYWKVFRHD